MKEEKSEYEPWLGKFGGYANSMTLRDYFAAKAMQGLMSGRWKPDTHGAQFDAYRVDAAVWAKSAYYFADAMLAARGEQK